MTSGVTAALTTPEPRDRLTREFLLVVLGAALATAPVFLFAEGWGVEHVWRVLASNGGTALLCGLLLRVLRTGHGNAARCALIFGLLAIVTTLAWTNGESVHVNVVNFVFVTVLASALLGPRALLVVGATSLVALSAIAFREAGAASDPLDARLEAIAQFGPTFAAIVLVLWLRDRAEP
jgi:hypothetical protein